MIPERPWRTAHESQWRALASAEIKVGTAQWQIEMLYPARWKALAVQPKSTMRRYQTRLFSFSCAHSTPHVIRRSTLAIGFSRQVEYRSTATHEYRFIAS